MGSTQMHNDEFIITGSVCMICNEDYYVTNYYTNTDICPECNEQMDAVFEDLRKN